MVMGKGEERNGTTAQAGESTFLAKSSSEASKMLEAALLQMDDIISGACAESSAESGSSEWKNSVKDAARNLVTAIKSAPTPPPPPDAATEDILLQWMQPVSSRTDNDDYYALFSRRLYSGDERKTAGTFPRPLPTRCANDSTVSNVRFDARGTRATSVCRVHPGLRLHIWTYTSVRTCHVHTFTRSHPDAHLTMLDVKP